MLVLLGSHVSEFLLKRGDQVLGIVNINDYHGISKKLENLEILKQINNFEFRKEDIKDTKSIEQWKSNKICHLASMAGVRYLIQHPNLYVDININDFINILEQAKKVDIQQIIYASSSSVYGLNRKISFAESDQIKTPNSPYARMAIELFAKTYHQLLNLNLIGLRFFTVYVPRGKPDLAPYKFLKTIKQGSEFKKYGDGTSSRDYTYMYS